MSNSISKIRQRWDRDTDSWSNFVWETKEYDANRNLIDWIRIFWRDTIWQNSSRTLIEYNSKNEQRFVLQQRWDGADWFDSGRTIHDFDGRDNLILTTVQKVENGDWIDVREDSYEYDFNNNKIFEMRRNWEVSRWSPQYRYYYYYDVVSASKELEKQALNYSIFPNPVSQKLFLKLNDAGARQTEVAIYNLLGKLLAISVFPPTNLNPAIDVSRFAEGTYFLQIRTGKKLETHPVLIVR